MFPAAHVSAGAGAGVDDPDDVQVPAATARHRNATVAAYVTWRPFDPVFLNLEARRVTTRQGVTAASAAGSRRNEHLNLAIGFEF